MPTVLDITKFGNGPDWTGAIQAAIDHALKINKPVYIPPGTYRHDGNLYVPGSVSIIGNGHDSVLQVGSIEKADGSKYAVVFGTDRKRGRNLPWTGTLQNLKITQATDSGGRGWCNIATARDAAMHKVFWDFPDCTVVKHIVKGQNDNPWSIGTMRRNITITDCEIHCHQNGESHRLGGEGLSVSGCDGVSISDNQVYGMADDAIAVLGCQGAKIVGNQIWTFDSRIKIASSQHCIVSHNIIERIADCRGEWYAGGGCSIQALNEIEGYGKPSDLLIYDNIIHYPKQVPRQTDGIKISGADNVIVRDNVVSADEPAKGSIRVEQSNDYGKIQTCSNVVVAGNQVPNGTIAMGGLAVNMPGPFEFTNNIADRFILFGKYESSGNQTTGHSDVELNRR